MNSFLILSDAIPAWALRSFAPAAWACVLLLPALSGSPLCAQGHLQPSFRHEVRGTAELERTDSGLIVRNLGSGPQDRVALLLGAVPTDREQTSSFVVALAKSAFSIPVNSAIRYELFGTGDGSPAEGQSTLQVTKFDSATVTYTVSFRDVEEIRTAVADRAPTRFTTSRLVFSVRRGSADSLREQVDCGCFRQEFSAQPVCVWEIRWSMPVRIYLYGVDTAYLYDRMRITAVGPDSFPEYITSLELSTDSIPTIRIAGEGLHRTEHWSDNVYAAAGHAIIQVDSSNRIVATGFENGTRDGLDVWGTSESSDGTVIDLEADLRNPAACIYTTFYGEADTAGYVGFVRDSIGIRLLATMGNRRSDSSLLDVYWENGWILNVPQNQTLGWILGGAVLSRLTYFLSFYPWYFREYRVDFAQPVTLQRESKFYTASSCWIEPSERIWSTVDFGNVRIRAGAIDTLRIGAVSRFVVGVEELPQRETVEPALQLIQRGEGLYIRYGGVEPGRGRLRIVDMAGRVVRELSDLYVRQAGGMLPLDILPLPSGAYLIELDVDGRRAFGKCILTER